MSAPDPKEEASAAAVESGALEGAWPHASADDPTVQARGAGAPAQASGGVGPEGVAIAPSWSGDALTTAFGSA